MIFLLLFSYCFSKEILSMLRKHSCKQVIPAPENIAFDLLSEFYAFAMVHRQTIIGKNNE